MVSLCRLNWFASWIVVPFDMVRPFGAVQAHSHGQATAGHEGPENVHRPGSAKRVSMDARRAGRSHLDFFLEASSRRPIRPSAKHSCIIFCRKSRRPLLGVALRLAIFSSFCGSARADRLHRACRRARRGPRAAEEAGSQEAKALPRNAHDRQAPPSLRGNGSPSAAVSWPDARAC